MGDVVYIRPKNSSENVNRLFELFSEHELDFSADTCVQLEDNIGELM
jgi:hypothetical protein